jgi:two-component system cell cycle sensor histidine kinase/response regulator CckA
MSSVRVMAVEDERLVARDLNLRLKALGYEVAAIAASAEEGIELVARVRPDVVLMDIRLDGQRDGIEAAQIIRERFDLPVVFATAHADTDTVNRALVTGPFGYILKPFDDRELRAAIEVAVYKHQTESRLRQTEARLSRAQRIAQLGNWEKDVGGDRMRLSDEACKILSIAAAECGSTTEARFFDLVHPDDRDTVREAFREAEANSKPLRIEHRIASTGAMECFVRQFAELETERSEKGRLLGTVQDITEYKRLEERLQRSQKLEAIGQLAGGVAHDFNNLLVVIKGYTDMILSELDPQNPLEPPLREVLNAADRAAALTRQLLAFSRRQVMRPQVLDINVLITEMEKMLRRVIVETIEVRKDLAATWPVKADPGQMEQVIMNLVVNARDAMPKGGVLTLGTADADVSEEESRGFGDLKPGRYVRLSVTDNGAGIAPEIRHRLFEPFFTTKPVGEGTGLGLSMVYGIVKQHGGDISVYSDVGRGSVFHVYLPVTDQPTPVTSSPRVRYSAYRGTETILLVEDDDTVRKLTRRMLEHLGYTVLTANNGREALDIVRTGGQQIDLLLTDVVMPEMAGHDLAQEVSSIRPGMKLVFMSGYPGRVTSGLGVSEANVLFLQKPFSTEDLGRRIRSALDFGRR